MTSENLLLVLREGLTIETIKTINYKDHIEDHKNWENTHSKNASHNVFVNVANEIRELKKNNTKFCYLNIFSRAINLIWYKIIKL